MTLHLRPAPSAAESAWEGVQNPDARQLFFDAYCRYLRARSAIVQARTEPGHEHYKAAFREQLKAREFFTDHALEFARVLMADDVLE